MSADNLAQPLGVGRDNVWFHYGVNPTTYNIGAIRITSMPRVLAASMLSPKLAPNLELSH
jgi:hypothetical protein